MASFSASVSAWVAETKQRSEAVWKESSQRVVSRATRYLSGELVNVQTGFLRASVRASDSAMPKIDPGASPQDGKSYAPSGEVSAVIAGAQFGGAIYIGYTASYSAFVHDGTSKMAPRPFVLLAAEEWPRIVAEVGEEAMSRASSRPR